MKADVNNPVLRFPTADPTEAAAFFASRMTFQTDVSDVHAALESGRLGFTLVDTRSESAWVQGHLPQAVHLPTDDIPRRAREVLDPVTPVVTYCWGPGCNGSTRVALLLSQLGYRVKEMIGGYEYWVREGLPVQVGHDTRRVSADPLTVAPGTLSCRC